MYSKGDKMIRILYVIRPDYIEKKAEILIKC